MHLFGALLPSARLHASTGIRARGFWQGMKGLVFVLVGSCSDSRIRSWKYHLHSFSCPTKVNWKPTAKCGALAPRGFLNISKYLKQQKDAVQWKLYTKQKLCLPERNKRNDSFRMRKETYLNICIKFAQQEIQWAFVKPEGFQGLLKQLSVWFGCIFLLKGN